MKDEEIRGKLLKHFYSLRHNNGGWVPLSDSIVSPAAVSLQVLGSVCDQLFDVGLIDWKPVRTGMGFVAGNAKITGRGVAAVEAKRLPVIDVHFEDAAIATSDNPARMHSSPATSIVRESWVGAAEALSLLGDNFTMRKTICTRAHAGLIKARANRLIVDGRATDDAEIPASFWWADGEAALQQNWKTGDFETWIGQTQHLKAFGVVFRRDDIDQLAPPTVATKASPLPKQTGGRPKASWTDDLWVEMCRQLYVGDLHPKRQNDISRAMMDWLSTNGHEAAESTVKDRARKLWSVIGRPEN